MNRLFTWSHAYHRRRGSAAFALMALAGALAACGDGGGGEAPAADTAGLPAFTSSLEVDIDAMRQTSSGLYIRDLTVGSGDEVSPGQTPIVHYTGWLPDGTQFDSSRGATPYEFVLGQRQVIPGWDEGVAGMRVGGRRQLVIPPDLGYGPAGAGGVIPPNSYLVFDVELMGIR